MKNSKLAVFLVTFFFLSTIAYSDTVIISPPSTGGSGGTPGPHASTHITGGTDPLDSFYATKSEVAAAAQGVQPKASAALASTANLDLTGEETLDGTLTSASRVFVRAQTNQAQNGLYTTGAGAWTRTTDADTAAEVEKMQVCIDGGATLAGNCYYLETAPPITLNTTDLVFIKVTEGTDIVAGAGLDKTGSTLSIEAGGVTGAMMANGTITTTQISGTAGITKSQISDTSAWEISEIPDLPATKITSGQLGPTLGGTGVSNTPTSGRYLKGNGSGFATSSGPAAGTGTCTNTVVTATNSDAVPTCSQVSTAMVADSAITLAKISPSVQLPKSQVSDTGQFNASEIPDLDTSKIISGIFDPTRLPLPTAVTRGTVFAQSCQDILGPDGFQRGINTDGTPICATVSTGGGSSGVTTQAQRAPDSGDACALADRWIDQSVNPETWYFPADCTVGMERWVASSNEAPRNVPNGVPEIDPQTLRTPTKFAPVPRHVAGPPGPGSCTDPQDMMIDEANNTLNLCKQAQGNPFDPSLSSPYFKTICDNTPQGNCITATRQDRTLVIAGTLDIGSRTLTPSTNPQGLSSVLVNDRNANDVVGEDNFLVLGNSDLSSYIAFGIDDVDGPTTVTQCNGGPCDKRFSVDSGKVFSVFNTSTLVDDLIYDPDEPGTLGMECRTTDPAAPTSNRVKWYCKNDEIYARTDTGVKGPLGGGTMCRALENVDATDDNKFLGSLKDAATITSVWCNYTGSAPTTAATFTLEDGAGNAMTITGTNPTCAAIGTTATAAAVTAGNTLTAREVIAFDVTNTPNPATQEYQICVSYTTP